MITYEQLKTELQASGATLVAVSKTHPAEKILALYEKGQRDFGENRHPELVEKEQNLPKDIRWHFIGHLQTKKVKYIAPFVHLIHAVDSVKLLQEINKQAQRFERSIDCLIQFKIAAEDSKYGLDLSSFQNTFTPEILSQCQNLRIRGVMGMATYTEEKEQIRAEFKRLKAIFDELKEGMFNSHTDFDQVSMGMSGDYMIALEEGSTMVRIGSLLFGERNY